MLNFRKPTWPKYISKLSFIKFILKSKELSRKQKVIMILFVLRMEKISNVEEVIVCCTH